MLQPTNWKMGSS